MWECDWKSYIKENGDLNNPYLYPLEMKYRLSEQEIMENVSNGTFFGAVECDIYVPEELKSHFEEMTPIFKNTIVKEEHIGEHMMEYTKNNGVKFADTRYLIGSMSGIKILLITPLLKWYLDHGLKVTKIYQVIQFNPKPCFKKFANGVSDDRRAG